MSGGRTSLDRIGKYEVLGKIGSGGFAIVYKGYDPLIKRAVAIKVCYSRDDETRQRFHREAEIAGSLVHRNITTVYDFGVHDRMPYLVEEYLSGEDLAQCLRRHQPAELDVKLRHLAEIASGLGHAHRRGVIHRDIKPGNIRVLDDGSTKIMDFGTAKLADVESHLTRSGMTLGTVAYLSPERLLGRPSGLNSDLFSYGVLAYELLSFRRPFAGRTIPELIDAVLNHEPQPLYEAWPECPPRLAQLVHRCLAKDPRQRFAECEEILGALRDVSDAALGDVYASGVFPTAEAVGLVTTGATPTVQVSGMLERARELHRGGLHQRALRMLEEVLELAPTSAEALALATACRAAVERAEAPPDSEALDRRTRQQAEAAASIRAFAEAGRYVEAAEALRFARRLLGAADDHRLLRRHLVDALRSDRRRLEAQAERTARAIVDGMVRLRRAERLDPPTADRCAAWVAELDPEDLAARDLANLVHRRARQEDRRAEAERLERRRLEARLSIEAMLDRGDVATARRALEFAAERLGEFDGLSVLRERLRELGEG